MKKNKPQDTTLQPNLMPLCLSIQTNYCMRLAVIICLMVFMLACQKEQDPVPDPALVYFLVGENEEVRNESFILALKDPDDIALARSVLANPDEPKIVVAEITKDKSDNFYVNKDLNSGRRWSWHVASLKEFTDFTIEIYDGWPGYVEDNYKEWVSNTKGSGKKGVIGFWNYSLKRELNKSELE